MHTSPCRTDQLLQALRRQQGVATSAELAAALGVSQPTVSRALAPLLQSGQVRKAGAARSQRYLLPRRVRDVGDEVLLMRVDTHGRPGPFGRMVPLQGGAFWVDEEDGVSELHDSLPWFLADMRPQGFMGRNFAHTHPELELPGDPRHWSDDDVLRALALGGEDLPGNLLVGSASLQRFYQLPGQLARAQSPLDYPQLAQQALKGTLPGSSAGGEQPKFCCVIGSSTETGSGQNARSVIVKFSSAGTGPDDERTRDLLLCEHLALQVLARAGLPAAASQVFVQAGRVFLESERFDRHSPWQPEPGPSAPALPPGRIGMVSLMVYDAQYVGEMDTWAADPEDTETLYAWRMVLAPDQNPYPNQHPAQEHHPDTSRPGSMADAEGDFQSVQPADALPAHLALSAEQFHLPAYDAVLQRLIAALVAEEGTLAGTELARRMARMHGFQRTGSRIQERVEQMALQVCSVIEGAGGCFYGPKER